MANRFEITPVADSIPFDNDTNGYAADNVQDAIEESRTSAIGNLIDFPFVVSGNVSNKWLGYTNSAAPSNTIPFIVPQQMTLKGLLFSNRDDNVDIDVELYINGTLSYTWEIRNKRTAYKVGIVGAPTFAQGDRISVFLRKYSQGTGDNTAQDPVIEVLAKVDTENAAEGGTQFGV